MSRQNLIHTSDSHVMHAVVMYIVVFYSFSKKNVNFMELEKSFLEFHPDKIFEVKIQV